MFGLFLAAVTLIVATGADRPPVPESTLGTGQVRVALILPLSAGGNAGVAGQAMRNAAEMAFAGSILRMSSSS